MGPEREAGAERGPGERISIETHEQLVDVVRWALSAGKTLEIIGAGSKRALGHPVDADVRLEFRDSGITEYQPEELVVTAKAGTAIAEIDAVLAGRNQMLAFEPENWSNVLYGTAANGRSRASGNAGPVEGTVGGMIACNLSGPRRIKAGAARDHLLGFRAVSGRGETFKAGGRVVKNVTGFDLSKLITGSYGTLAVLSEVTLRTVPLAEETLTLLVYGCGEDRGIGALSTALQCPCDVSAAAHLPPDAAECSTLPVVAQSCNAVTAIRLEGPASSVAARAQALQRLLAPFGPSGVLDRSGSLVLWREIGSAACFADLPHHQIWRLSVPPAEGPGVVAEILFTLSGRAYFDWGGGLIWLAIAPAADAAQALVRGALAGTGGHATLVRAPAEVRACVPVFQPQPAPLAALTRRIKKSFDPAGVLNPGRMDRSV